MTNPSLLKFQHIKSLGFILPIHHLPGVRGYPFETLMDFQESSYVDLNPICMFFGDFMSMYLTCDLSCLTPCPLKQLPTHHHNSKPQTGYVKFIH